MIKIIKIQWQRLLNQDKTCPRCNLTEQELNDALIILKPILAQKNIEIVLEKRALTLAEFQQNPQASNLILINGLPLESYLGARTGTSPCCDVCGTAQCRTVELNNRSYETIPAEIIVQAVLNAVSEIKG
jgi:hypothetical protein